MSFLSIEYLIIILRFFQFFLPIDFRSDRLRWVEAMVPKCMSENEEESDDEGEFNIFSLNRNVNM